MPDFETEGGGLSDDFFDVGGGASGDSSDAGGGGSFAPGEMSPADPLGDVGPEDAFDIDGGDYGEMGTGEGSDSEGGGGGGDQMTTSPGPEAGDTTEPEPGSSGGGSSDTGPGKDDKSPKGSDPVTQITTGLGVLKNVLESLTKLRNSESKPPAKVPDPTPATPSPPKQGTPNQPLPYPVQLDDIPVTVPTGGKPSSVRPAKAPSTVDRTVDRVRAALARARRETPQ